MRLMQEHEEIGTLFAALEQQTVHAAQDGRGARPTLERLAGAVKAHLATEDDFMHVMIGSEDAETRNIASNFILEFDLVRREWIAFVENWQEEAIALGWDQFCEEACELLRRLRQRVREEEAVIYPLALQRGCITLR